MNDDCFVIEETDDGYEIAEMKFRDCWYVQHAESANKYLIKHVHVRAVEPEGGYDECIPARDYFIIVNKNNVTGRTVGRLNEYARFEEAQAVIDHCCIYEALEENYDLYNRVFHKKEDAEQALARLNSYI